MIKYIALFYFLFIVAKENKLRGQQIVLHASDYISVSDSDAVAGVLKLLKDAYKRKATKIIFQKGTYHFYDDLAFERYAYISNHDFGARRMAFPLIDFHNLEIDGGGAEFIMHGLIIPFSIENSSNIEISNVRVNWSSPTHSELKVVGVSNDVKNPYVDYEISNQYPYEIKNGELLFTKKGFQHNLENGVYFDPVKNAVAYQSRNMSPPLNREVKQSVKNWSTLERTIYPVDKNDPAFRNRGIENSIIATQLQPGLVRVTGVKTQLPKIGWVLVAKGMNGYNRLAPAFRLYHSDNIELNNVTVHHASGMGLIADNCKDVTLNSFNVMPDKKDGRMIATTADATHFVGCRGLIKMDNCRFENQFDDATNIHGTYFEVMDFKGRTAGLRVGHFQQSGYQFARSGDTIYAVDPHVASTHLSMLIVDTVEMVNPRYFKVTFKQEIGTLLKTGYYLENSSAYPEVEIKNCTLINNRARGFLILTPRKVLIEGNTFSNMMSAIQVPNEFTFWYESGYVTDLTIRNNTFLDGSYGTPKPIALINILAVSKNNEYIHGRINIENNTFTTFGSAILRAEFVKNIIFKNNIIKYSGNYPLNTDKPVIDFETVGSADISNNKYDAVFKNFISTEHIPVKLINKNNEIIKATKK